MRCGFYISATGKHIFQTNATGETKAVDSQVQTNKSNKSVVNVCFISSERFIYIQIKPKIKPIFLYIPIFPDMLICTNIHLSDITFTHYHIYCLVLKLLLFHFMQNNEFPIEKQQGLCRYHSLSFS